jgi:hypothetical protein
MREARVARAVRPVHDDRGSVRVLAVWHRQRGVFARRHDDVVGPEPDHALRFEGVAFESDGLDELPYGAAPDVREHAHDLHGVSAHV